MMKKLFAFVLMLALFSLVNLASAQDPGLPDTCWVERLENVPASSQVVLNVYLTNDEAIGGYAIPLTFPDPTTHLDIVCDSVSFVGTRSAGVTFGTDSASIFNDDNVCNVFAVFLGPAIPIGTGVIAKMYFTTGPSWNSALYVPVDTITYGPAKYTFTGTGGTGDFHPIFYKGALEVKEVNTSTKPKVFSLSQNYPNPFNPNTVVRFGLPKDSWVKLEVYNVLGQKVKTLVDEELTAGLKEVEWDGRDENGFEVASGIYFYKIKAEDFSDIKKMVLLK